jgi:hypothetical protein
MCTLVTVQAVVCAEPLLQEVSSVCFLDYAQSTDYSTKQTSLTAVTCFAFEFVAAV